MKRKTCIDCPTVGTAETFAKGRNLCKPCASARAQRSKAKRSPLKIGDRKERVAPAVAEYPAGINMFETRQGFTTAMLFEYQRALNDAREQVDFHKTRLDAAVFSGEAKAIEEASQGWHRASSAHASLISRLSEKLQALGHLGQQTEKAKPVTFYLMLPGEVPDFVPMKVVPAEYYPDAQVVDDDVSL